MSSYRTHCIRFSRFPLDFSSAWSKLNQRYALCIKNHGSRAIGFGRIPSITPNMHWLTVLHKHGTEPSEADRSRNYSMAYKKLTLVQKEQKNQTGIVQSMQDRICRDEESSWRITHMGFVSLASSQSQYFSVMVFFFFSFSPCTWKL
jgi:hypothetical protein